MQPEGEDSSLEENGLGLQILKHTLFLYSVLVNS